MCKKCGCNTCETDSTALMLNESKAPRSILSEGLKHHIDANKPLTNNFYSAGSRDYFDLIAEARSLYSRGILDFTNKRDIELLTETDQGHFGIYEEISTVSKRRAGAELKQKLKGTRSDGFGKYDATVYGLDSDGKRVELKSLNDLNKYSKFELAEGKKVPLDFPMLNEAIGSYITAFPDAFPDEPEEPSKEKELVQYKEDLKALIGKYVGDFNDNNFIIGVKSIMNNWLPLLRSQKGLDEAKFKGKTVDLNKPTRGDSKKFKVYVNSGKKNADGSIKVKKVNFGHGGSSAKKAGQKTMSIRKSNPKARKAFRARHNCDNPGPKTMARYWSCKKW